jgi:cytochrome c peroxidase
MQQNDMTRYLFLKLGTILLVFLILGSCTDNQGDSTFALSYPDYFPDPVYQSTRNPITKKGFELGRALFHDPILSVDSTVSCETCHAQGHAFADHNVAMSVGIFDRRGVRNSPPIFNAAWQPNFMWDGGINHIEVMPVAPITNDVEMGETMANVVKKLNRSQAYRQRFKQVFNVDVIDDQKLLFALAQYMSMLVSSSSKYDQVRQNKAEFTSIEQKGYDVFVQKCSTCHQEPLFSDFSFRNTGLTATPNETGRNHVTLEVDDMYKFRMPSLRNVALTYPYMHDGRFKSLREVLDHYSENMQYYPNLDPIFKLPNGKLGIPLSENEKTALESFLRTLSDYSFTSNPIFSE